MSASGHYGKQGDEMFLQRKNTTNESPVIEPLRIQKRSSGSSANMSAAVGQQQPASASQFPMPSLPYPDDRARQEQLQMQAQAARANGAGSPYQYPDPRRVGSPQALRTKSTSPADPAQRVGSAGSGRAPMPELPGLPASLQSAQSSQSNQATLAERRGTNAPKPLPESPGPDAPDKDGLFQKQFRRTDLPQSAPASQTSFPAPTVSNAAQAAFARLNIRDPNKIGRIDSTASNATTKATRGSPPPPESPLVQQQAPPISRPLTDIEQRFANSGIAGAGTLTALQAQSAAAQARQAQYGGRRPSQPQSQVVPPRRPWTPTEQPGASPHPAPTVYQGDSQVNDQPAQQPVRRASQSQQRQNSAPYSARPNQMENETNRLPVNEEPPPAYSSVTGARPGQYPAEKGQYPGQPNSQPSSAAQPIQQPQPQLMHQQHPAFANDPRPMSGQSPVQQQQFAQQQENGMPFSAQSGMPQRQPSQSMPPSSPPPLPEGWIAHLDPNSGQYYYIHLPTQSTQWEFPKGPTPLNLNETPLSPTGSMAPLASPGLSFMGKPLNSPGLPVTPGFDQQSVMSMSMGQSVAFTGPPPTSGVDIYKVAPTNGVYFGPYLRYTNIDLELGFWYGSILLVTDAPQPPTIHLHQSADLSPNPRQLKAQNIATHQRWIFYKYEVDIRMEIDGAAKWTYAITSHLGCTRYEFLVAGRYETNWRFIATSGNDFSINTSANERARLGGPGYMWKDITQKHAECGGFHVQLGLGGQISADRLWKEIPSLKQWLAQSGKDTRKNAAWTAAHEEDVNHAYFHYYTSHFDQPFIREAWAQIPQICQINDHDM